MMGAMIDRVGYTTPAVAVLVRELQAEYVTRYGGPDETPVDPADFTPPGGSFLVLRVDGEPVGCVGLRRRDPDTVEMKRLFVRQAWRGRGLARSLLARAEDEARDLGYRRLVLETGAAQPEAIALYESAGYEPIPGFGHYRESPMNRCFARDL